jgi:multiple sugar transport system permease protein
MKTTRIARETARHVVLTIFVIAMIFPTIIMLSTSFKAFDDLFTWPPHLIPVKWEWSNYQVVLVGAYHFYLAMLNSFAIAVGVAALSVLLGFPAAYGLSRYKFRGRSTVLFAMLATQMFSPVVFLISLYEIVRSYGLLNTYTAVILSVGALTVPMAVWLLHGFLSSVPIEIEEAASVDGASRFRSIVHIVTPLAAPGIAMVSIYAFIAGWNNLLFPLVFLSKEALDPISLALTDFAGRNIVFWNLMMAAGVIATLPVAVLFNFVQRNFVKGITGGALK